MKRLFIVLAVVFFVCAASVLFMHKDDESPDRMVSENKTQGTLEGLRTVV